MVTIAWVSKEKITTLLGQTKIDHRTLADYRGGSRVLWTVLCNGSPKTMN